MNCQHPECLSAIKPYGGKGPRPLYCEEHSTLKARKARSRAGIDPRPECCRAQGRGKCPGHKKVREHAYGRELHPDSILSGTDELTSHELSEAQVHDVITLGLRISSPWGAVAPRLTWGREPIPVIGQADLTVDWEPINPEWRKGVEGEFGCIANPKPALVWRGPEWPWAELSTPVDSLPQAA